MRSAAALLLLVLAWPAGAWDLDTVTVTGTGSEKRLADTPVVTEVITADEIKASGASDLTDVLTAYGVIADSDESHGDLVSLQGLGGGRVLILIDGRRVAGRLAQNVEGASIPLLNVDRIEIVRGPQSALYGSDAMGGVINIITRRPTGTKVSVHAENTSLPPYDDPAVKGTGTTAAPFQSQLGELGLDIPLGGWSTSWNLSGTRAGYYWNQTNDVSVLPSLLKGALSLEAVHGVPATGAWTLGASASALDQTDQTDFTGSLSEHNLQRVEAHARFQTEAGGGSWDVQTYQQWYRRDTSSFVGGTDTWTRDDAQIETLTGFEAWHTRDLTTSNILTLGVQATLDGLHDPDVSSGSPFALSDGEALVVQDEQYQDGLYSVVTGLRVEHGAGFGLFAAPKVAAQYTLVPGLRFLGGAGTGYRVPSVQDRYYDIEWSWHPIVLGNPDLKPEYSLAANAGVEWVPASFLSSRVNAWHQELFDEITYLKTGTAPDGRDIYRNENFARTSHTGIDTELAVSPLPEWTVQGAYSWLQAFDRDTGATLVDQPENSFRASLRYDNRALGLAVHFGGQWDSTRRLTVLDCGVSQSWKNGLEVYGRGENLASAIDKARGPYTPVSVTLGLRYRT